MIHNYDFFGSKKAKKANFNGNRIMKYFYLKYLNLEILLNCQWFFYNTQNF